jgi:hypothetical protein
MRSIIRFALLAAAVATAACSSTTEPTSPREVSSGYIFASGAKHAPAGSAVNSGYIYASGRAEQNSGYLVSTGRVCDAAADPSCTP